MEKEWELVYKKRFNGPWYPREAIVKFTARYIKRRVGIDLYEIKKDAKKVLDVGCGNGRHVVFFAEQAFNVSGIDISKEAIDVANAWLNKKGLTADLRAGVAENLPFKNEEFDVVISDGVLDHIPMKNAKEAVNEMKRVLKQEGYLFLKLRATTDSECGRGVKCEKNTYILQEGYEKGIIQHFFDKEEISELLTDFKIFDIVLNEELFPDIFTVDKAYLQSSEGKKVIIEDIKEIPFNLKYGEWFICAEKRI